MVCNKLISFVINVFKWLLGRYKESKWGIGETQLRTRNVCSFNISVPPSLPFCFLDHTLFYLSFQVTHCHWLNHTPWRTTGGTLSRRSFQFEVFLLILNSSWVWRNISPIPRTPSSWETIIQPPNPNSACKIKVVFLPPWVPPFILFINNSLLFICFYDF